MKNSLFFFFFLVLFSCQNEKQYQGKWSSGFFQNSNYQEHEPSYFIIESDSIKFNYGTFSHWHKFKLHISENTFHFNNRNLDVSIDKDTLRINKKQHYIRDPFDSIQISNLDIPILSIDLPKLNNIGYTKKRSQEIISHIYFGRRLDNGKFSIQLNDKYAKISDLRSFLNTHSCSIRDDLVSIRKANLYIDRDTSLKHFDLMLDEIKNSSIHRIGLINNICFNISEDNLVEYNFEVLTKRLSLLYFEPKYRSFINDNNLTYPPPLPPPSLPEFKIDSKDIKHLFLVKNQIYINKTPINDKELTNIIYNMIENKKVIFSLYDLESNYMSFLKMNSLVENSYNEFYNKKSKLMFSKSFDNLDIEEHRKLRTKYPKRFFWDISIPHYQILSKNESSVFGKNLVKIDSLIPN